MGNKIINIVKALVFVGFAVILVLMMIQDFKAGLGTWKEKGFFALYAALLLYALWRIYAILRDLFHR